MKSRITSLLLLSILPLTSSAQEYDGYLDFHKSVAEQIERLEPLVRGDMAAERQVVVLQWLIELYTSAGRYDDVERSYQRILAWFPHDIGTLNAYATFVMDERGRPQQADSLLRAANAWARAADDRSVYRGRTLELWGSLALQLGDAPAAINRARSAIELLDVEDSAYALRVLARANLKLEQYDGAATAYLQLIAIEGGANREDINAFQTFIAKTTNHRTGSIRSIIDAAVAEENVRRRARVEASGGRVVTLTTGDQVALETTLRHATGQAAVLFVPDVGGRRAVFTPYAQLLFIDDITTMSVDPRGHGGSRTDSLLSYADLSEYHRDRLSDDIVTACNHLKNNLGYDESRIAIVSAGSGCAIVEKALKRGQLRTPAVYLSPEFDQNDRELINAMAFHGDRPTLVLYSSEDIGAMHSLTNFREARKGMEVETRVFDDAGHGVELLRREPAALAFLQSWLRLTLSGSPLSH